MNIWWQITARHCIETPLGEWANWYERFAGVCQREVTNH